MIEEDSAPFHLDDLSIASPHSAPPPKPPRRVGQGSATALRREINQRALAFAHTHRLPYDTHREAVLFSPVESTPETPEGPAHGNFHPDAYQAILANPLWAVRLAKAHTAHKRAWLRTTWRWRELDTAVSSDALLMNVFCFPGVLQSPATQALLGIPPGLTPEFGYKPRLPLHTGRFDRTEIDLRLGSLLLEAKLTESSFGSARPALVERYRDLHDLFDPIPGRTPASTFTRNQAPRSPERPAPITAYQLLRGILAAHAEPATPPATFCLLADARRPDLQEAWYTVIATVRTAELRSRLQMLTWQELAATLPAPLQCFLEVRFGITPRT